MKCPEIKARYGFRGLVGSGRAEVEYNAELSRHTLTRFLELVLFLDRAKVRVDYGWLGVGRRCGRYDSFVWLRCWAMVAVAVVVVFVAFGLASFFF